MLVRPFRKIRVRVIPALWNVRSYSEWLQYRGTGEEVTPAGRSGKRTDFVAAK